MERAFSGLVVLVSRHDLHKFKERVLNGFLRVRMGNAPVGQRPFDQRRIVAVEPRPAVLVALGKPFQKCIGSFKHEILKVWR